MKVTENDKISLAKELSKKLLNLSCGRLTEEQSDYIAKSAIDNIDFENSALVHKGLTWYAENIIDMIDFERIK